ncbi:toll/interleukin-1 receptor domain-containing protein [Sphaerisporangium rhizosphaerae]|uniref:Toll/interleukin-1 receptor domain-containing protein n=1 Tax=Sphaerisporangium rhizosphaerae TaxID=2269375 RepID=A0ABW2NWQ7_9ACTN
MMAARDVFLCHANGDKRLYVRPLAEALARRGVSCWIDEAEIEIGDSIVDAVNAGLRLSRYVLVIITDNFLSRPWTRKEMNAALSMEMAKRKTVVLPILAIDPTRWVEEFPLYSDRLYLDLRKGVEIAGDAIAYRFGRSPATDWAHDHPKDYRGPVWVRCTPGDPDAGEVEMVLRWGPYIRKVRVQCTSGMPMSLIHHKTGADSITLHVSVDPAAIVTFGVGPAPDQMPRAMNIDEGWIRAAGMEVEHPTFSQEGEMPKERDILAQLLDPQD